MNQTPKQPNRLALSTALALMVAIGSLWLGAMLGANFVWWARVGAGVFVLIVGVRTVLRRGSN